MWVPSYIQLFHPPAIPLSWTYPISASSYLLDFVPLPTFTAFVFFFFLLLIQDTWQNHLNAFSSINPSAAKDLSDLFCRSKVWASFSFFCTLCSQQTHSWFSKDHFFGGEHLFQVKIFWRQKKNAYYEKIMKIKTNKSFPHSIRARDLNPLEFFHRNISVNEVH